MKIGILTFHNAYNYGAVLQAYALQTFLKQKGYNVQFIDYRNANVEKDYVLFKRKQILRKNVFYAAKYCINETYRYIKFKSFHKNVVSILNISSPIQGTDDIKSMNYDVILIGSDQLWNTKITDGYDSFYWGFFPAGTSRKVITYAICMNVELLTDKDKEIIKRGLNNFSYLSVRESNLRNILESLSKKNIYMSVDPTFLLDRVSWKEVIEHNHSLPTKYVLVYAILESDKVIKNAKKLADMKQMKLIIMKPIAEVKAFKGYYQPSSPFGFISAIAYADYVVTSSFHGLAFSLIFKKQFYVMGDSGKNERMKSLLSNLDISERFIESIDSAPTSSINYSNVSPKLDNMRSASFNYLNEAINS